MKTPLDVLREANRRRKSSRIETPLDLLRILNRGKRSRASTKKILERISR